MKLCRPRLPIWRHLSWTHSRKGRKATGKQYIA